MDLTGLSYKVITVLIIRHIVNRAQYDNFAAGSEQATSPNTSIKKIIKKRARRPVKEVDAIPAGARPSVGSMMVVLLLVLLQLLLLAATNGYR